MTKPQNISVVERLQPTNHDVLSHSMYIYNIYKVREKCSANDIFLHLGLCFETKEREGKRLRNGQMAMENLQGYMGLQGSPDEFNKLV